MENRAHALAAGLFTLVLGAALVAVGFWFSKDDIHLAPYLVTTSNSVAGLKVEAPVRYRGVEVGKVESIRLDPDRTGKIQIRIGVIDETPVTKGTFARLGYQGVTGLAYVALDDDGHSAELLKSSAGNVPQIRLQRSVMESGEDLLASFGTIAARVNALLDENNQKAVRNALAGLEQVTRRAATLAEHLEPGAKGVTGLVGDARGVVGEARGAVGKADQLMTNLNSLTAKLDERVESLKQIAKSVEDVGAVARSVNEETVPRLNALADQLNRETRALDRLLNSLGEHPQSIVFGPPPARPGPGEPGFSKGETR